jgi:multiple inositol-polyphosphate phosphatase / 2,3-bisphosphoglycerate 3-phosphatase
MTDGGRKSIYPIFSCPNDRNGQIHKIQFILNERVIELDWCRIGLCDFSKFLETYQRFTNTDCTKTFCGGSSGVAVKASIFVLITVTISTYLF